MPETFLEQRLKKASFANIGYGFWKREYNHKSDKNSEPYTEQVTLQISESGQVLSAVIQCYKLSPTLAAGLYTFLEI